jgi:hypothetical protein
MALFPFSFLQSQINPDAQAFITATGITNPTEISAINTLVNDLQGYGLWTKMKAIYPFVGGTSTTCKYNLKDPRDLDAAFRLVFNGGWTFASTGATPNGVNGYADTKLVPSSNGLTYDNNHLSFYSRTSAQSGATQYYEMGSGNATGTDNFALFIRRSTDLAGYDSGDFMINRATFTNTNGQGFYCGTAPTTTSKYFKNGTSQVSKSLSVKSLSGVNVYIGGFNENNSSTYYSNKQTAFASIGDGLSDSEASNLYSSVQQFNTTLSRNV